MHLRAPLEFGMRPAEYIAVYEISEDGMLLMTNVLNRALHLTRY